MTLGGVAEQADVDKCLAESQFPLRWINFQCDQDWTVKHLYKIISGGGNPIGVKGVKKREGHEVENYEVDHIVKGHLKYRKHLQELILMTGLNHE